MLNLTSLSTPTVVFNPFYQSIKSLTSVLIEINAALEQSQQIKYIAINDILNQCHNSSQCLYLAYFLIKIKQNKMLTYVGLLVDNRP